MSEMATNKKSRTVLCLGPPHSGKSVFSYLLFKFLRGLGNDCCVMEGDYYSPTYRRLRVHEFASPDEEKYIIVTPNLQKLDNLKEETFHNLSHSIHDLIEFRGVIVIDGLGRHSRSTESLLELAEVLIVLCPDQFCVETDSEECCYVKDSKKLHPFDFYANWKEKCIMIRTHYRDKKRAFFDESQLAGELFDLDRDVIERGNTEKIPEATRSAISEIGKYILNILYGAS